MSTFGLIAEGITDQIVIENILYGYLGDDIDVRFSQPLYDDTTASRLQQTHGGWENVLNYFAMDEFIETLQTNEYVIIQIDTDVSEQFGVSKGNPFDFAQFVNDVRQRIVTHIGESRYELIADRILFAICVHSLECWLLPLYAAQQHIISTTDNCSYKLENELARNNIRLSNSLTEKSPDDYEMISRPYLKKRRKWENDAAKNRSLALFLAQLDGIVQRL